MIPLSDNIVIKETLYDSAVTRVQRGLLNNIPVIIKTTAQDIPGESLIGQYRTSYIAQNGVDHPAVNKVIKELSEGAGRSLILEDVGGITLKEWINTTLLEQPRWPLEDPSVYHSWMLRLLRWSILLSEGISACHQQNVIHNDINPANVVVNPVTDQVQLIDFGAAFPDGSNIHEWTVVEQHRTLTYISPEQTGRLNRNIDYRSDYYALGATLYQLFSSMPPFVAHDLPELIHCHIARHPIPLDHINPLIPESLSALVVKLMAKAPEDRYQNGRCLIHDLKSIENALIGGIPFPLSELGKNDVPEQLLIPAKLYGREQELVRLQKALNSHHDKPALIAVEGEAGGGKTTLITEAILYRVDSASQLLTGKSEAYNKKPHNALSQALVKSVGMLMSLPDNLFISWRSTLLEALNNNPHTLISLCPELMTVFETADFAEEVPIYNADIQLKLHTALFLQNLSALEPVLLFIDDVQWCDGPSISLLEALIKANHPRITVMVTCRSEEVDGSHPYSLMKENIQESGIDSVIVKLRNLDFIQVTGLLSATFHIERERLDELAKIVLNKTLGNPLFVHEFLKAANHADNRALYYDNKQGRWEWNKQRLKQIATSGNVAVLLIDALYQQDPSTQDLLQWAACIGTRFNEALLAQVTGISIFDIKKHLNSVYKQGYIHRIADQTGNYAFNHDRIRQAYYELLSMESLELRHWVIGLACWKDTSVISDDPLPHFLAALRGGVNSTMLPDNNIVKRVVNAFYVGALSARNKTANDIALQYTQCAIGIAETMRSDDVSQFSALLLLQGELGYLTADILLGGESFDRYRSVNNDVTLQASSFSKQAPLAFMRGDVDGSISCSLHCFRLLGVDTPFFGEDITEKLRYQRKEFERFNVLERISSSNFSNEVVESDDLILQSTAANMLLLLGTKAKYQWAEWFGLVGVNSFLKSSFSMSTLQLLALFDSLIFSSNKYKFDQTIVDRTIKGLQGNHRFPGVGFVYNNIGAYSGRYSRSMSRCLDILDEGAKVSFDKGEYLPYLACFSNKIVVSFSAGLPLQKVQEFIQKHQEFLVSCGEFVSAGKYYSKIIEVLTNPKPIDFLDKSHFTNIQWKVLSDSAAIGTYHHLKLLSYFWNAQYLSVVDHYKREAGELEKIRGMAQADDNYFIYSISCLKCREEGEVLEESIKKIEYLAEIYPKNFRHKWLLILAEKSRLDKKPEATSLYGEAAMDAKENGFIHMYALSHELHARYWMEQGRPDYTKYHIIKAMEGYQRWGCVLKLEKLYEEFGHTLDYQSSLSSWAPVSKPQLVGDDSGLVKISNLQGQKTLLKIANMISEELDLKQRLLQISQIMIENTEADGCVLLLKKNGEFQPQAIACLQERGKSKECYVRGIDGDSEFSLPVHLISECAASKKTLQVRYPSVNGIENMDSDFFLSQGVKSLLCYPIVHKGRCQSILLLTNANQENSFARQDLQFLNTLAPQFSVSIENALLYKERQNFNVELEQRVDQRTLELQAANDELEAFTASVTHDLKAPLRAIKGFTSALAEDYEKYLGSVGGHHVDLLVEASDSMERIIDGLLKLSQFTQSTLFWEEVNVSTLVEDKLRWLRTMEPEHSIGESIQQGLTVNGDLRLIRQVIDNLIENAWKYSRSASNPKIHFGMLGTDVSPHTFYIQDNGVGFDASNVNELFVPFRCFHSRGEFDGMGIGLATAYRIVRRHGGAIWAISQPGKGATFYFTLNNGNAL